MSKRRKNTEMKSVEDDFFRKIEQIPKYTNQEILDMFSEYKNGNTEIRKQIIEANLRLVVFVANRYKRFNVPFIDLIEDGCVGLIKAVNTFDLDKGMMFSTLATKVIENEIVTAIEKREFALKASQKIIKEYYSYFSKINNLTFKLGREPYEEEIIKELGITEEKYYNYIQLFKTPVSIHANVFEDEDSDTVLDIIEDENAITEDYTINKELQRLVRELIENSNLTDREKKIVKLRYGLDCERALSFDEIAEIFGVKKQRIDQIEKKAIQKLRVIENGYKTRQLRDFL